MSARILEICVDDAAGVDAAVAGGADRIELCSALTVGGLTPSPGLMTHAAACGLPIYAMIRPRAGDFVFSADEIAVMRADIDAARAAGLTGVVLGASRPDGRLDDQCLARLMDHARDLGKTLHRAFDLAPDLGAALETACALGFERILTSGGAGSAEAGRDEIARLAEHAAGRLHIMPGSGITPETTAVFRAMAGICEIHASASVPAPPGATRAAEFGFATPSQRRTDPDRVATLRRLWHDETGASQDPAPSA